MKPLIIVYYAHTCNSAIAKSTIENDFFSKFTLEGVITLFLHPTSPVWRAVLSKETLHYRCKAWIQQKSTMPKCYFIFMLPPIELCSRPEENACATHSLVCTKRKVGTRPVIILRMHFTVSRARQSVQRIGYLWQIKRKKERIWVELHFKCFYHITSRETNCQKYVREREFLSHNAAHEDVNGRTSFKKKQRNKGSNTTD